MIPRYAYLMPDTVKFSDKCEWQNGLNVYNKWGLVWCTDRSKTERGTGAGVCRWDSKSGHSFSLRYFRVKCISLGH
jgi:hypothetical protein